MTELALKAVASENPATFRAVLAATEFRALWSAELFSQLGDQFARVAIAVLVFRPTSSAALTGLTYLPSMVGGLTLSWIGDRYLRREVIFVVDLLRAALVALMALPGMPCRFWASCWL